MAGLRANGLRVTAVHRHMVGETPTMSFVHYLGVGPADELARSLRAALDRAPSAAGTGEVPGGGGMGSDLDYPGGLESGVVAGTERATIVETLGVDPASAATGPGYCKVSRPRTDLDVSGGGIPVDPSLGIGSWFAFRQTAAGDSAVIAGDMALTQRQANRAIQALREARIEVVALQNHMLHEEPRIMYFHFQERGAPMELARGLRSGLAAAGLVRTR